MGRISININEKLESELRQYHLTKGGKLRDFSKSIEELLLNSLNTFNPKSDNFIFIPDEIVHKKLEENPFTPEQLIKRDDAFNKWIILSLEDIEYKKNNKVDVNKVNAIQDQYEPERVPSTFFEDDEERDTYGYHG